MPEQTTAPRVTTHDYVLVALDWGNENLDIDALVTRLGDAVVSVESGTLPHYRTGVLLPLHRITLDGNLLRNTEAHGIGYRARFIVNTEACGA